MTSGARIAVLISGSGSNLQAILDACERGQIDGRVVVVISDKPAFGLERAARAGVRGELLEPRRGEARAEYDRRLLALVEDFRPDLAVLAGFMRILSAPFVDRLAGRMLNIHPSLLPAYKGLDTHARALADGQREHGATVHFVTPELDSGPAVIQGVIAVTPDDDVASVSARVHRVEHTIYPLAVEWFAAGRLVLAESGPKLDGEPLTTPRRIRFDD